MGRQSRTLFRSVVARSPRQHLIEIEVLVVEVAVAAKGSLASRMMPSTSLPHLVRSAISASSRSVAVASVGLQRDFLPILPKTPKPLCDFNFENL